MVFFFYVFCFHYLHKVTLLRKGKNKKNVWCSVARFIRQAEVRSLSLCFHEHFPHVPGKPIMAPFDVMSVRDGVCGLFKQAYIYTMYMLTLIQGSYQGNNFLSLRSCGCIISSKFQQFKLIWFKRWQLLFFFVRFIFMFVSIKRHHLLSEWDIAK